MTMTKTTRTKRRMIGAVRTTARIMEHAGILGVSLCAWANRNDHQAQPDVRRAADTALDAIASISALLADLRSQLLPQIAENDAAAAARTAVALAGVAARMDDCEG